MGVGEVIPRRAVFLDRDGVLNQVVLRAGKPYPPANTEELRLVPGVEASLHRLKQRGFLLLVVTNQPDIARGTQSNGNLNAINDELARLLPLDAFFICPHDNADACACRKPKPGLFHRAHARYHVDLDRSYMIGDRWRDVDAAHAAGVAPVWIDYGYDERGPELPPRTTVKSLPEAVDWIVAQEEAR